MLYCRGPSLDQSHAPWECGKLRYFHVLAYDPAPLLLVLPYEAQEVAKHATGGSLATHRTPDNLK